MTGQSRRARIDTYVSRRVNFSYDMVHAIGDIQVTAPSRDYADGLIEACRLPCEAALNPQAAFDGRPCPRDRCNDSIPDPSDTLRTAIADEDVAVRCDRDAERHNEGRAGDAPVLNTSPARSRDRGNAHPRRGAQGQSEEHEKARDRKGTCTFSHTQLSPQSCETS